MNQDPARTDPDAQPRPPEGPEPTPPWQSYALASGLTLTTTGLALLVQWIYPLPDLEVIYLLSVMIAAIWLGRGPAILGAALGVAAYDYFFVPPFHTFAVGDARYFPTFAMMFGVGFLVSELTTRLRHQERVARAREERTAALYALSRDLADAEDAASIAAILARHVAGSTAAVVAVLGPDAAVRAVVPPEAHLQPDELRVARWCLEQGRAAGFGTENLPDSPVLCVPFGVGARPLGALALRPREPLYFAADQLEFFNALCRNAAFAMERLRLSDEARAAALRSHAEEMRSTLLSAVSHDLRTPLAVITGAATLLRDDEDLAEATRGELIESLCDEAERLERLVGNLLDMTRLQSGALALARDWIPLEEMVGSALNRLESRLGARPVRVQIDPELPLLRVDPVLFEQIFVNLFENAAKYTPADSPLEIDARLADGAVRVEVADRGPGLPAGSEERVFEAFFRGVHVGVGGAGLGLPICRGLAEAHGGALVARAREGGGVVFELTLPVAGDSPTVPEEIRE